MQLGSHIASHENKGETLQRLKKCTAAENIEAFKAAYKRLDARKISEDAARNGKATQKQVNSDVKSMAPVSTVCHAEESAERTSLSRAGGPGRATRELTIF